MGTSVHTLGKQLLERAGVMVRVAVRDDDRLQSTNETKQKEITIVGSVPRREGWDRTRALEVCAYVYERRRYVVVNQQRVRPAHVRVIDVSSDARVTVTYLGGGSIMMPRILSHRM